MAKQKDVCNFNWQALKKVSNLCWLLTVKFNVIDQTPLNKQKFSFFMIYCQILKLAVKTLSFLKSMSNSAFYLQKVDFICASDVTENCNFE